MRFHIRSLVLYLAEGESVLPLSFLTFSYILEISSQNSENLGIIIFCWNALLRILLLCAHIIWNRRKSKLRSHSVVVGGLGFIKSNLRIMVDNLGSVNLIPDFWSSFKISMMIMVEPLENKMFAKHKIRNLWNNYNVLVRNKLTSRNIPTIILPSSFRQRLDTTLR